MYVETDGKENIYNFTLIFFVLSKPVEQVSTRKLILSRAKFNLLFLN